MGASLIVFLIFCNQFRGSFNCGSYSVRGLATRNSEYWRRERDLKRHVRARPGHPCVSAQRMTEREPRGPKSFAPEAFATIRGDAVTRL
jgi:hypothetical protein